MSSLAGVRRNIGGKRNFGLAVAVGLSLAVATPAFAQQAQQAPKAPAQQNQQNQQNRTQKSFDSWNVTCVDAADKTRRCAMTQTRIVAKTKQLVFAISLTRNKDNSVVSVMTTPTGVSVRDGIRLALDGVEPLQVPFDVCGPRACQARATLDDAFVKRLAAGSKASANFVLANKRMIQTEVDLKGFKAAYAYMVEQSK